MPQHSLTFEGRIETARIGLYAARAGQGEPLLFIGGSNFDMRIRCSVFCSALPGHFDTVTYEPRGLGRSDAPDGAWTMADYAEDARALMTALGWTRARVMGESFGAMTAMELAIRYPEMVEALCLTVGAPGGKGGSSYPIEELLEIDDPRERAIAALRIQDSGFETLLVDDPQAAEERIVQRIAFEAAFMGDPSNATGYPRLLKARAGHDVYDRLKMIEAPTIVIAGERDGQAPIESGRAMARKIPGARFLSFDGGHNMTFATPGPVAAILKAWGR